MSDVHHAATQKLKADLEIFKEGDTGIELNILEKFHVYSLYILVRIFLLTLADLEGVYGGCTPPPFKISKIKETNKTKQKIEDNPLEKEEERKSCMFV